MLAMTAPQIQLGEEKPTDYQALHRLLEEIDARTGFVYDPDATPERAREMMRAEGIRAEDNLFSRDILRQRYPEDYGEDEK